MPDGEEFDTQTHALPLWARRVRAVYRRAMGPLGEPVRKGRKLAAKRLGRFYDKRLRKLYDKRLRKPVRRLSKATGKMLRPLQPLIDRARLQVGLHPLDGRVDWAKGAQVGGWVIDPQRPGRRVHVIARCEGEVVAETLADLARRDLVMQRHGDGRHGFVLQLPAAIAHGPERVISIEALAAWGPRRLAGGEVSVGGPGVPDLAEAGASGPEALGEGAAPATAPARPPAPPVALLVWGEGAARRTLGAWSAQSWPNLLSANARDLRDPEALQAFARSSHTVILARAGDAPDPELARIVARVRPIADVLTWDDPAAPWGSRPEARALGVLLGEGLGGGFAVRGHVLADAIEPRRLAGERGLRELELALAADRALRWAHAPAPLLDRSVPSPSWRPLEPPAAQAAEGFYWRAAEAGLAPRLVPAERPDRITLAVWPAGGPAWTGTVKALVAGAPDVEIEVLAPAGTQADAFGPAAGRVEVRPIDAPQGGEGEWMRLLGEAASGEVVVFCRAGVRPPGAGRALDELCAWALSPYAGAVTVELEGPDGPLAGVTLADEAGGWRLVSSFEADRAGQSRPVLAASGLFAVARAKLAAVGGVDDHRFPDTGAELDLCLRLRQAGLPSMLLGGPGGAMPAAPSVAPHAFAAFDPLELAGAAAAFRPAAPSA
jgi:hypothetical protein